MVVELLLEDSVVAESNKSMIFFKDFLWCCHHIEAVGPLDELNALLVEELEDEVLFKWVVEARRLGPDFPCKETFAG